MDRNICICSAVALGVKVALHPEGVDRNTQSFLDIVGTFDVALHPEGVDRNFSVS